MANPGWPGGCRAVIITSLWGTRILTRWLHNQLLFDALHLRQPSCLGPDAAGLIRQDNERGRGAG